MYEERALPAVLCAILTAVDNGLGREPVTGVEDLLDGCDWDEAGVPEKWVLLWWRDHKKADKARRARESKERAAAEKRAALRASARAKLTPEELAVVTQDDRDAEDEGF